MKKRWALLSCLLAVVASMPPAMAQAGNFPNKPVRLLVGFPPGGLADIGARLLSQRLPAMWGQQVIVDNRAGASGIIAAEAVARSPADGYTLLVILTNHTIIPAFHAKVPYDTLGDFAPVVLMGSSPVLLMANPKLPAKTMPELVALAKTKPGALSYSTPGDESVHHLSQELLDSRLGIRMAHVPYKGGAQAMMDAIGGTVDLNVGSIAQSLQQVQGGKLVALGVSSTRRSPLLPDVPTFAETVAPGFSAGLWVGVLAPKGTPAAIVAKLNADIEKVLTMPETREFMTQQGIDIIGGTPESFGSFLREETRRWGDVAARAGVKPE